MVLTNTHNVYFEQKYEKYQSFYLKNFQFLEVKFSIYLKRRVFVMEEDALCAGNQTRSHKSCVLCTKWWQISKGYLELVPLSTN